MGRAWVDMYNTESKQVQIWGIDRHTNRKIETENERNLYQSISQSVSLTYTAHTNSIDSYTNS